MELINSYGGGHKYFELDTSYIKNKYELTLNIFQEIDHDKLREINVELEIPLISQWYLTPRIKESKTEDRYETHLGYLDEMKYYTYGLKTGVRLKKVDITASSYRVSFPSNVNNEKQSYSSFDIAYLF